MGRIINIELAGCCKLQMRHNYFKKGDCCCGHTAFVLCCGDSFYPGFAGCSYCSPRCCQFIPRYTMSLRQWEGNNPPGWRSDAWIIYALLSADSGEGEQVERSSWTLFSSVFPFTLFTAYCIIRYGCVEEFHCICNPPGGGGVGWSQSLLTCRVGVSRTDVAPIVASVHTLFKTYGACHLCDRGRRKVKCIYFCATSVSFSFFLSLSVSLKTHIIV